MRASTLTVTLAIGVLAAVPTAQAKRLEDTPSRPAQAPTRLSTVGPPICHRARYPEDCQVPTRIVAVARADGFDWGDAGIGAGGALGAVLVATGVGALLRRPHRIAA
jgi:hypothetical protein